MKFFPLLLAGLMAGTVAAPAVEILSESFEFGPGVPARAGVKAGDFFHGGPVQSGPAGTVWIGHKADFHPECAKFLGGGGLRLVAGEGRPNFSFSTDPDPAKLGGGQKTITASVEFLPGTLWGKDQQASGFTGIWIGLHGGDMQGLMASMKNVPIVATRLSFEEDNAKGRLWIYLVERGALRTVTGKPFDMEVHTPHRLTLKISPKGPKAECELVEIASGKREILETKLAAMPPMKKFQVDLTSLRNSQDEIPPEVKKVTLKSE